MAASRNALARSGLISTAAMNATLAATKVQKSKMTKFDSKVKDEGNKDFDGHGHFSTNQINAPAVQKDRAKSMPSKGARVNASYVPGRKAIDQFPKGQHKMFPAGGKVSASGKKSVGVKGGAGKSSGPMYGGPNSRAAG